MKEFSIFHFGVLITLVAFTFSNGHAQKKEDQLLSLNFEGNDFPNLNESNVKLIYDEGIKGQGLDLIKSTSIIKLNHLGTEWFSNSKDFSISVWMKSAKVTTDTTIILSNADFRKKDMGIYKNRRTHNGFTLYSCNGTWGWNIGNGRSNYNYEPVVKDQPIADNKWHQIVFAYSAVRKEVRLFYDGINRAILSIGDLSNKDFASHRPLMIGKDENAVKYRSFPGIIDELQVSATTLTQKQVKKSI